MTVLFTSFAHFEAKVATRSADRTSHGKGIFTTRRFCSPLLLTSKQRLRLGQLIEHHMAKEYSSRTVLFTSFAHFEAKVATRSADRTSHGKGIFTI